MNKPTAPSSLWRLARSGQPVDAERFALALAAEVAGDAATDFRTELLVRDGLDALASHWGRARVDRWLAAQPAAGRLADIWHSDLGPPRFTTLVSRMTDETKPDDVLAFFRELGTRLRQPSRIDVGGSTSLILAKLVARQTDDIDVVDELPAAVRGEHDLLNELAAAHGLRLTHFQSHYLPDGWQGRTHHLGRFGHLDVHVVDVFDVLVSKLTSARRKDRDDLRAVAASVDRNNLADRLRQAAGKLLADSKLRQNAQENWYIVYGETLPC